MVGVEVWGGLAATSLQPMVERLIGITRDASANPTQQLSAVRVIIGFERQQFARAKYELSVRRLADPDARGQPIDSVVSPAIIEYLFNFLTSIIHQPDISDRIAISAGNLIHSLQRLLLAEQRWHRLQASSDPAGKKNKNQSPKHKPGVPESTSDFDWSTEKRPRVSKSKDRRQTGNNGLGDHGRSLLAAQISEGDHFADEADWPTDEPMHVPGVVSAAAHIGFA